MLAEAVLEVEESSRGAGDQFAAVESPQVADELLAGVGGRRGRRDDVDGVGVARERAGRTHGGDARQIRGRSGDPLCLLRAVDGDRDGGVAVRWELRPEGLVDLSGRG